jgi:lipopolysaccharide transport system permease protein
MTMAENIREMNTVSPDAAEENISVSSHRTVIIEPSKRRFFLNLRGIWEYRELLLFLAWRDLKVRYSQTTIGFAWAVIQPVAMMLLFTLVFSNFAKLPSDGVPYPLFAYAALLPWGYFSRSLDRSSFSVVAESGLISKVYFPRIIMPISALLVGLVDFAIAFVLLLVMMVFYGVMPSWQALFIPVFLLLTMLISLALSLWLAALFVRFRDIAAVMPLVTQLWMFASPVVYPVSLVPEKWRLFYHLNPMVGVIEGFRWAFLGTASPDFGAMALSASVVLLLLICGIAYFNRVERTFADVI